MYLVLHSPMNQPNDPFLYPSSTNYAPEEVSKCVDSRHALKCHPFFYERFQRMDAPDPPHKYWEWEMESLMKDIVFFSASSKRNNFPHPKARVMECQVSTGV